MRRRTLAIISSVAISALLLALVPDANAARGFRGGGAFRGGGGRSVAIGGGFGRGTIGGRRFAAVGRPGFGVGRPGFGVARRGFVVGRPGVGWAGGWRPGVGWGGGWGGGGWGWGGGGWGWPVAVGIAAGSAWGSNQCWAWNGFRWVNTCNQWSSNWW